MGLQADATDYPRTLLAPANSRQPFLDGTTSTGTGKYGGYLAAEHLIDLGHRHIACLVGPNDLTPSAGRIAGFQRALADAGLAMAADGLVRGNGHADGGAAAAQQLLERGTVAAGGITAIFAFNDQMAIGAIGALQRAGCRVPEDISVVGFDDIPQSATIFPALTTIAQPIGEMGRIGVRLLLDRIARREAPCQRVRLSTRLVVRESTGPPSESGVGKSVRRGGETKTASRPVWATPASPASASDSRPPTRNSHGRVKRSA